VVDQNAVAGKHILLIDDVFTTGATCNEAAFVLLENGAGKVDALVLART
jgi:competence protein ComFC